MERCGKCGMVEESSIHDINSPDTEIRRVAHHFELVAPCPQCALKDADLAAANARAEEAEQKLCAAKEQLKVACKWLAGSEWGTIEFERVMDEINAMAPHVDNASP